MVALLPPYTDGVASIAPGATTVTVTGILDDSNCVEGDDFRDPVTGYLTPVLERIDATHFRVDAWRGAAMAASAYQLYPRSSLRLSAGGTLARVQDLIGKLKARGLAWKLPADKASPDAAGWGADEDQDAWQPSTGKWWNMEGGAWVQIASPYGLQPAANLSDLTNASTALTNLGVVKQTSALDVTAGSLLLVGAFGLGTQGSSAPSDNLNLAVVPGFYVTGSSTANSPQTFVNVMVMRLSSTIISQIAHQGNPSGSNQTDFAYIRGSADGGSTWTPWRPLVPLFGTNSNGKYIRFADGTQICWNSFSTTSLALTAYGSVFQGDLSVTFPAAFAANPTLTVGAASASGNRGWANDLNVSISGALLTLFDVSARSVGTTFSVSYTAIGRWF